VKVILSNKRGQKIETEVTTINTHMVPPNNVSISLMWEETTPSLEDCYKARIFVYDKLEIIRNNRIYTRVLNTEQSRVTGVNHIFDGLRRFAYTTYYLDLVTKQ
jgi:hypothetical protein